MPAADLAAADPPPPSPPPGGGRERSTVSAFHPQHWGSSPPGPVHPGDWVGAATSELVRVRFRVGPSHKASGTFGMIHFLWERRTVSF